MSKPAAKPKPVSVNKAVEEATRVQLAAADPVGNAWTGASAGSGKTKVLTDRVLRLLLPRPDGQPGTDPSRILCLTFTKAAASEMALRLNKRLGRWAVMDDATLAADLETELLGRPPNDAEIKAARALFARVVDAPGGLNLMTIHAFCGSILGQFPLEAGLSPHFEALEEAAATALLSRARDEILTEAQSGQRGILKSALTKIAAIQSEDFFDKLLKNIASERRQLADILKRTGGMPGLEREIFKTLGLAPGETGETILKAACTPEEKPLRAAAKALADHGTEKTDFPKSVSIQNFFDASLSERLTLYNDYKKVFLTGEGEVRDRLATKNVVEKFPSILEIMQAEAERLLAVEDRYAAARSAELTYALLTLGQVVLARYESLKTGRASLDFDDLIYRTLDLLKREGVAGWVMYKLDGGLDHILVDEAQDTNPEQWDILKALTDEFFVGKGTRGDISRTFFAVGDEKQSIYSFQRAAPAMFHEMRAYFSARTDAAGIPWQNEPINTSFRSAPSVLGFVDEVFSDDAVRQGVSLEPVTHGCKRDNAAGLVELWPLFENQDKEDNDAWTTTAKPVNPRSGTALLAEHIGTTIRGWLDRKDPLESRGRPITPGDILILVKSRNALVNQLIRALKTRQIPVSGVDRMVLKDQLAIMDMIAAAQVALLPEDDLSLACLLKSPFIGWDDARLESVAAYRGNDQTLWQALQQSNADCLPWLNDLKHRAGTQRAYEFFSHILHEPCPADGRSGLHAVTTRLGDEASDPLDEFLNRALKGGIDGDTPATLQAFLIAFEKSESTIKREQEEAGGRVRIMTVHAAKGLQAPIVILPDTVRAKGTAQGGNDWRLIWPDKSKLPVPLWSPRKDTDSKFYAQLADSLTVKQDEEYRRLFYVALTRAEDRLYIGGAVGKKGVRDESWYNYAHNAFTRTPEAQALPFAADGERIIKRLSNKQTGPSDTSKNAAPAETVTAQKIPAWALTPARAEPQPTRPLMPSKPEGLAAPVLSPRADRADLSRFRRGNLTHRLLQTLPDLPANQRAAAAKIFIERQGSDLSADIQNSIIAETLALMASPDAAPLFGPGSLAEIPVTGAVNGKVTSGQIDRLLITPTEIWIADYKTNRPAPRDAKDIPDIYRAQLQAYRDIIVAIYKDRPVRCFLLWTDGPLMMEVKF